jgi:subtilisin-like proprotein convertase family protein
MFRSIHRAVLAALAAAIAATALTAAPASAATNFSATNSAKIAPGLQGAAEPSPIQVSGLDGPVERITVALHGVTHQKPEDFDILLVSPQGQRVLLASDACGASNTSGRAWVFSSYGNFPYLELDGPCPNGAYRETDYTPNGQSDTWPHAPAGRNVELIRALGTDGNGTWSLHVVDDKANYAGQITGGWTLDLNTVPSDVRLPTLGSFGIADPYPAKQTVSGQTGVITDLDVRVGPLWHERLDDLDIYLVGPQGQRAKLMSDSCGDFNGKARTFSFDDEAFRSAPDGAEASCGVSDYKPTDNGPNESAPQPAPGGPWPTSLTGFDYTDPNGEWQLYVYDGADGKTGWIGDYDFARGPGFKVVTTTRPRAQVSFADADVRVTEGDTAELVLERNAQGGLGAGTVTLAVTAGTATQGADYRPVTTPVRFAAGDARKTVPVETIADVVAEGDETLTVTVASGTGDAQSGMPATAAVTIGDRAGGPDGDEGPGAAPDTVIEKAPKRKTTRRKAKLVFASTEGGSTFECKLDRRSFKPCGSPRRLRKVRTGKHVFLVRAVDADGNADPTPAKRRWRVVGR